MGLSCKRRYAAPNIVPPKVMYAWAIRLGKCESANQYARQLLLACETLARDAPLKKASAERNGARAMQQSVAQSRWMSR